MKFSGIFILDGIGNNGFTEPDAAQDAKQRTPVSFLFGKRLNVKQAYTIFITVIIVAISLMAGCRDNRKIADKLATSPPINNGVHTVDESKKKTLVESLSTMPEPYVVSIERFFDGNMVRVICSSINNSIFGCIFNFAKET